MSTRQLLNLSLGSCAFLFLVALGAVLAQWTGPRDQTTQIDLAKAQVEGIEDLSRRLGQLEVAEDFEAVQARRADLGREILRFDSNLNALLRGGSATLADGAHVDVEAVRDATARAALQSGAELWREIGLPLADLAAGEYSIFSAAGQQAVQELHRGGVDLAQAMETAAQAMGRAASDGESRTRTAQAAALLLGVIGVVLAFVRFRPQPSSEPAGPRPDRRPATADDSVSRPTTAPDVEAQPIAPNRPGALTAGAGGFQGFQSPVDFDSVNASVDQLSVDMNTIAGSTEKMRLAIDSVGHALQGMIFSLNEMAQDTAEGHKVVRGANNAASYTATAAEELADSSREMAQVVSRVTQLALKTRQVAAQIDAEAVGTGQTGEAFTSVVATEVKGLAVQTSRATSEIEETVATILATARQYEEAIGQIIKNIAGINKVAQNLGEMMLHPPQRVVPGTPLTPAPPVAESAPQPAAPAPAPEAASAPAPAPVPQEPAAEASPPAADVPADEAAGPAPEPDPEPDSERPVDPWGGIMDEPDKAEKSTDEVAAETRTAIEETATADATAEPEEDAPAGSNSNVFILGGGAKKKPAAPAIEAEKLEPEPEPEIEEPAADPLADGWGDAPAAAADPEAAPQAAPEDAPADVPEDAPEVEATADPPEEDEEEEHTGSNIFMLQTPKKKKKNAEPAPEPAVAPQEDKAEEEVVIGGPAGGGEGSEDVEPKPGGNIFMLNKKK